MTVDAVKLVVAVPASLHKRLQKTAETRGETLPALVRQALADYLARAESEVDDVQFAAAVLNRMAEGAPTYTHEEVRETTFEVRVPTELLAYGLQPDDIQNQVLEWLVLSLFKEERISSGKAARLLGLTRIEFLALLRRRGVAYVDYSPLELSDELAAVRSLAIEPRP
jgi:predicted HTH domain antitoxin/predicted transcriptional regulator